MKITGIAVALLGDERQITVSALLGRGEQLEAGDMDRLLGILNASGGEDGLVQSGNVGAAVGAGTGDGVGNPAAGQDNPPATRRRGQSAQPAGTDNGDSGLPDGGTASAGEPTSVRRSRRVQPAEVVENPTPAGTATDPAPSTERRSRRQASATTETAPVATSSRRQRAADPSIAAAPVEAAPASVATGRRRAAGSGDAKAAETSSPRTNTAGAKTQTTKSPSEPTKISDADMSKAASEAALVIPVAEIKDYIQAFGVSTVGDIKQEDRREFLDELRAWITEKSQ